MNTIRPIVPEPVSSRLAIAGLGLLVAIRLLPLLKHGVCDHRLA
jgi:hypothetical protein